MFLYLFKWLRQTLLSNSHGGHGGSPFKVDVGVGFNRIFADFEAHVHALELSDQGSRIKGVPLDEGGGRRRCFAVASPLEKHARLSVEVAFA